MPTGARAQERTPAAAGEDPMAVETCGSGDPLVLLHGLATTRVIWRHVLPILGAGRRVITLDVPGFGGAPPVGPGFGLEEVAERIAAVLEEAGVGPSYDLVGHSMGGAVALTLAARRPEAVRRLVLVAPAGLRPLPLVPGRVFGAAAAGAIALRRQGAPLAALGWGRRLLMSPGTADPVSLPPADVQAMLAASRGATRIATALATAAAADLRPLLRTLPVAVGAVWGERDRIIPPGGVDTLRALRPEAPVELVERAGHIPMMERPAAFVEALEAVLSALSRPGNNRPPVSA